MAGLSGTINETTANGPSAAETPAGPERAHNAVQRVVPGSSDGYTIKLSERAKRAARAPNTQANSGRENADASVKMVATKGVNSRQPKGNSPPAAPKARTRGHTKESFVAFQREEALGRYSVLADEDSDEEDDADAVDNAPEDVDMTEVPDVSRPTQVDHTAQDVEMEGPDDGDLPLFRPVDVP